MTSVRGDEVAWRGLGKGENKDGEAGTRRKDYVEEKVGAGFRRSRGRGKGGWHMGEGIAGGVRTSRAQIKQDQGDARAGASKMTEQEKNSQS